MIGEHLETFLTRARARNRPPPRFVEREFRRFLRCGIFAHGLAADADPEEIDPITRDEPLLAALYSASVRGRSATGPRAGQAVLRFGDRVEVELLPASRGPRCANIGGVSLHANVAVPARDRLRLERLCRYAARPPLATERLSRLSDGRLLSHYLMERWTSISP